MDIISELKKAISPELLSGIAQSVGEPQAGISKALDGIFPTLLGSIIHKAGDPGSANVMGDLMGMLQNAPSPADLLKNPTSLLDTLSGAANTGAQSSLGGLGGLAGMAGKLLPGLLGNKAQGILEFISSFAGIKASSVTSLLNMALPLITSVLGKKLLSGGGLSLAGLTSYLFSQKDSIINAAPAGLGSALGLGDLSKLGSNLSSLAGDTAIPAVVKKSSLIGPIAIGVLLLAALFAWKSCSKQEVETKVTQTVSQVQQGATAAVTEVRQDAAAVVSEVRQDAAAVVNTTVNAAEDLWAHLGQFATFKLPNGIELRLPELGVENKLIAFISDASKPVDKTSWFSFDRLLFETGSATLKPESQEQLKNIAEILKAYPNVELKIGGYTDNTGDAQANVKLSQDRADSVMNQLVGLGIAANRITASGYGEEHPVAANDTPENRAKNRRIDVLVTQK